MGAKRKQGAKVRFAIVGLGHIAQSAMLPAFKRAGADIELTAFVSGDKAKLEALGREYGVPHLFAYDEYDRLLEESAADAIYIALPNHLHADYAERALRRGVHVLCEKPLAMEEEDCRRLVEAAEETGARLMTAYRLHFDEANHRARELARHSLGDLRFFHSVFSYPLRNAGNIRLRAEEGGPLWDIGIYCINAARHLFAAEPREVLAQAAHPPGDRFRDVPETVSVSMKFAGERLANFICSFGAGASPDLELFGTEGRLRLQNAYGYKGAAELSATINEKTTTERFEARDQFVPMIRHFAECVRRNEPPEPSGFEGWADTRIMRAIERSLETGERVSLKNTPTALSRWEGAEFAPGIAPAEGASRKVKPNEPISA